MRRAETLRACRAAAAIAAAVALALPAASPGAALSAWDIAASRAVALYEAADGGLPAPGARPSCTGVAAGLPPHGFVIAAAHCGHAAVRLPSESAPSRAIVVASQFVDALLPMSAPTGAAQDVEVLAVARSASVPWIDGSVDLPWRDEPLRPGDTVAVVGYGCGQLRAWAGVVTGVDPDTGWVAARSRTPLCGPGFSGAGAWDLSGRLAGIVVAMDGARAGRDPGDAPRIADSLLIEPAPIILGALRGLGLVARDAPR